MFLKMYLSVVALLLVANSALACEEESAEIAYVSRVEWVTPPSYESGEIRYQPEAKVVTTAVTTESGE